MPICAGKISKTILLRNGRTLEPFHFSYTECCWTININTQTNWKAPKSAQEQEDPRWRRKRQSPMCCKDSGPKERKVEKLRARDHAIHATQTASKKQATLQRKSTWKKGNETSEERETRLQRMRDRLAAENSEERDWRLQQTRTKKHTKLAVETREEITLQQRTTNQREWLAVETPKERELRFNRVLCREQHMLPQLLLFQQCSIQSLVSSPDQIFLARPVDSSKNRVWTLSLQKPGVSLYMAVRNWVIGGIISICFGAQKFANWLH